MLRMEFSEAEKEALHYQRYHHPHPRVQQKMEALWLKSQGLQHQEIAKLTGITENTLRAYLQEYQEGGVEKLKETNFYRPQSELMEHKQSLEEYFRKHPPSSTREASAAIEQITGIKRSPTQVRQFLKQIGMRCLKVGVIPDKADTQVQEEFKKTNWIYVWSKPKQEQEPYSL